MDDAKEDDSEEDREPISCSRCASDVAPGRGEFYIIDIEAKADPTPPVLDENDLQRDYKSEINAIVAELENVTPQNQRLTIQLCMSCYATWMENPAGTVDG